MTLTSAIEEYDRSGSLIRDPASVCGSTPCVQCGESWNATPGSGDGTDTGTGSGSGNEEEQTRPLRMRQGGWIIALLVLASLGVLLVLCLEIILMTKMTGIPYAKRWRSMWLGQLLLLSILLCYFTLYAFVPEPTVESCSIIRFCVGGTYAMCFSILLVKLMIILSSKSVGYLKGIFQVLMFFFAWAVQLVIDTQWLILKRPGVISHPDDPDRMVCQNNAFLDHVLSLIYIMVLIVICTILCIKSRRISTNHRESVFIGLSAGFAIPIWIAWILLGMLIGDPEWEDPCMAFGLFVTATLILFNMYLPKVRQLNTLGLEGIYAEDDTPDYEPSVAQAPFVVPVSTNR